jgi:hypothetical protein
MGDCVYYLTNFWCKGMSGVLRGHGGPVFFLCLCLFDF